MTAPPQCARCGGTRSVAGRRVPGDDPRYVLPCPNCRPEAYGHGVGTTATAPNPAPRADEPSREVVLAMADALGMLHGRGSHHPYVDTVQRDRIVAAWRVATSKAEESDRG